MNTEDLILIAGYLANPDRNTLIEIEMHPSSREKFESWYATASNNFPLPNRTDRSPYYIWPDDANKWGRQSRVYFTSNQNLPEIFNSILEPRSINTRHGYEKFDKRFNGNYIIDRLIELGFVVGTQDADRIKSFIPEEYLEIFNLGFYL